MKTVANISNRPMHAYRALSIAAPRRGFTMIEIMVVVSIIALLAAITIVVGKQVKASSQKKSTDATMESLSGIMARYLKDHPEPDDNHWVKALQAFPDTAADIERLKPVLAQDLDVDMVNNNYGFKPPAWPSPPQLQKTDAVILDGFGNPIHYISTQPGAVQPVNLPNKLKPTTQPNTVAYFWSYGADKFTGTSNGVDYSGDDVYKTVTPGQ